MCFKNWKKKKEKDFAKGGKTKETTNIPELKEKPKPMPTTRTAAMEIIVVNEKTDKEYSYKSTNNLGLSWQYGAGFKILMINQENVNGNYRMANLSDFSIIKVIRETFKIE